MERSAKETDNLAIKVTSTGNVNGKSSSIKTKKQKQKKTKKMGISNKKESNLFFFFILQVITLGDLFKSYLLLNSIIFLKF